MSESGNAARRLKRRRTPLRVDGATRLVSLLVGRALTTAGVRPDRRGFGRVAEALVEQFVHPPRPRLAAPLSDRLAAQGDAPQLGVDRLAIAHVCQSAGVTALSQVRIGCLPGAIAVGEQDSLPVSAQIAVPAISPPRRRAGMRGFAAHRLRAGSASLRSTTLAPADFASTESIPFWHCLGFVALAGGDDAAFVEAEFAGLVLADFIPGCHGHLFVHLRGWGRGLHPGSLPEKGIRAAIGSVICAFPWPKPSTFAECGGFHLPFARPTPNGRRLTPQIPAISQRGSTRGFTTTRRRASSRSTTRRTRESPGGSARY